MYSEVRLLFLLNVSSRELTLTTIALPDFAYSTTNSSFSNRFRELIVPYDCGYRKTLTNSLANTMQWKNSSNSTSRWTKGPASTQTSFRLHHSGHMTFHSNTCTVQIRSNVLSITDKYTRYRQNPTVKQAVGEYGEVLTVNTSQPTPIRSHLVPYDVPIVPSEPEADLAPVETLELNLRDLIDLLRGLFEERPAWTRRGLRNYLKSDDQRNLLRHAIPYVGYIFRSGPWRDAIIKFGIDPRTSPEYRHYQTFMYRILPREVDLARESGTGRRHNIPRPEEDVDFAGAAPETGGLTDTHIFTGQVPLPRDGRIWMAIDIKDPILANILYPPKPPSDFLRAECEIIADGWFGNGTLAKVKTIMRAKIQTLIEDRTPSDEEFACILPFPDHAFSEADIVHFTLDPATASSKEITLATEVRASIKGAPMWRKKHERERFGMDGVVGPGPGRGGPRQRGKAAVRFEEGALEGEGEEEDGNEAEEESEGEEEERERAEMLEAQVAAAVGVMDADEGEEDNEDEENDDEEEEEEDESDEMP